MVILIQLYQEFVGISRIFSTVLETLLVLQRLWLTIKGACMVSWESNLTWPIAIQFLRAVFSLFRALKENLLAFITGRSGIAFLRGY